MRFPIDVLYLDSDKVVVYARANLKPWRVAPVNLKAASVLELPSHTLDSTGTVPWVTGWKIEMAAAPAEGLHAVSEQLNDDVKLGETEPDLNPMAEF